MSSPTKIGRRGSIRGVRASQGPSSISKFAADKNKNASDKDKQEKPVADKKSQEEQVFQNICKELQINPQNEHQTIIDAIRTVGFVTDLSFRKEGSTTDGESKKTTRGIWYIIIRLKTLRRLLILT